MEVFHPNAPQGGVILTKPTTQHGPSRGGEQLEDMVVQFPSEEKRDLSDRREVRFIREVWRQITFGVGAWGTLRPLVAALLAAVPFLFLGQHFTRKHRRGFDWFLLQIPLALTLILWAGLYLYSIYDAWSEATKVGANTD
jgi:hypothetical protein